MSDKTEAENINTSTAGVEEEDYTYYPDYPETPVENYINVEGLDRIDYLTEAYTDTVLFKTFQSVSAQSYILRDTNFMLLVVKYDDGELDYHWIGTERTNSHPDLYTLRAACTFQDVLDECDGSNEHVTGILFHLNDFIGLQKSEG